MTEIYLTLKEQWPIAQRVCTIFGVDFEFVDLPCTEVGYTDMRKVFISKEDKTRDTLVSVIVHEFCHIKASKMGIYKSYHLRSYFITKAEVISAWKTAVNAETYIDVWAEKLTKQYFPGVKYQPAYRSERDKKLKKAEVDSWAKDLLSKFAS